MGKQEREARLPEGDPFALPALRPQNQGPHTGRVLRRVRLSPQVRQSPAASASSAASAPNRTPAVVSVEGTAHGAETDPRADPKGRRTTKPGTLLRVLEKQRLNSKYRKRYEPPNTPYKSLLESGPISAEAKEKLQRAHASLDPSTLRRIIGRRFPASFSIDLVESTDSPVTRT